MKIDWAKKLTSRKLWLAAASLAANIIIACGGSQNTAAQVTAIIMGGASVIGYIIGEGLVDAAHSSVPDESLSQSASPVK